MEEREHCKEKLIEEREIQIKGKREIYIDR